MRGRILVVEDNQASRELLCDWLEAEGCEALSAENLEQAFAALRNQPPPQAVLLDVQLGPEDGLSVARWIRQEPALQGIPVIAVTAQAMPAEQERIIQTGCNACASKPVDLQLLGRQLARWLDHVTE